MASLPQILKIPSLDSTIGAVLLGAIFGSMLYGLTVHQTYRYFKLYPKDRLFLKSLVLTILVFETLHTAVWIVVIYRYAITDAFNLVNILRSHWSIPLTFLITSILAIGGLLLGPRSTTQVISMFGGLAAGIEAFLAAPFIVDLQKFSWLVSSAYGFDVVTDVILTSTLVLALHNMRTGFERLYRGYSDSVCDQYWFADKEHYSIISIIAFIFAIVIPGNLIYAAVSIVGSKLYANSVLAALNSRQSIDNRLQEDNTIVFNREAFSTSVPSARPLHRMDPDSVVYSLREKTQCCILSKDRSSTTIPASNPHSVRSQITSISWTCLGVTHTPWSDHLQVILTTILSQTLNGVAASNPKGSIYFKLYPRDRLILKILVLTIIVFETLHTAVWIVVIYHYAITDAFHLSDILRGHWSIRFTFPITGLAVFVCQRLCNRFTAAAGTEAFLATPFIVDLQHISWLVSIAYGFAVATDIILTSALIFVLYKWKSDSKRGDSIVDTLILYTINTGLLTSIISTAAFIFAIVIPGNLIYAAVSIVGTKLYANSILAALNSRHSIGGRLINDSSPLSLGANANGAPSAHPQQAHVIELESMVYNVPEQYLGGRSETSTLRTQDLITASAFEGK
ncbi:hypothetical protein VTO73DRAFT_7638 [Trametes versicolor]